MGTGTGTGTGTANFTANVNASESEMKTSPRIRTRCYTPSTRATCTVTAEWVHTPTIGSPIESINTSPDVSGMCTPISSLDMLNMEFDGLSEAENGSRCSSANSSCNSGSESDSSSGSGSDTEFTTFNSSANTLERRIKSLNFLPSIALFAAEPFPCNTTLPSSCMEMEDES